MKEVFMPGTIVVRTNERQLYCLTAQEARRDFTGALSIKTSFEVVAR
jgi:hypothetical protein